VLLAIALALFLIARRIPKNRHDELRDSAISCYVCGGGVLLGALIVFFTNLPTFVAPEYVALKTMIGGACK
jgi:hypothetical protein